MESNLYVTVLGPAGSDQPSGQLLKISGLDVEPTGDEWPRLRGSFANSPEKTCTTRMNADRLVKTGLLGAVGCFRAPDRQIYPRDAQVVCRTERGLEIGTVLCSIEDETRAPSPDGDLLRVVGREDQMLIGRLEQFRDRAYNACNKLLKERGSSAVLVDVEHLFDGESLYFYFLGQPDPEVEQLTSELAETYERKVKFRKFAETLASGCGPDCGTKDCSTGSCAGCALAGGCGK